MQPGSDETPRGEKVGLLFNRSSLLLTARLDKVVASLVTSQTAEGGVACLPQADNEKQVEATIFATLLLIRCAD